MQAWQYFNFAVTGYGFTIKKKQPYLTYNPALNQNCLHMIQYVAIQFNENWHTVPLAEHSVNYETINAARYNRLLLIAPIYLSEQDLPRADTLLKYCHSPAGNALHSPSLLLSF